MELLRANYVDKGVSVNVGILQVLGTDVGGMRVAVVMPDGTIQRVHAQQLTVTGNTVLPSEKKLQNESKKK